MHNVFITGGAGFLGKKLLARLAAEHPDVRATIYSRDNGKHSTCRRMFPQHRYIVGDVRDYDSLELAMAGHDTVIHAAAFKYVPEGETNAVECHAINVGGSLNVARAAIRLGVEQVIGISTDKACAPVNVYGMTKALMERVFQEADRADSTRFKLVRYGNVVSSTGSAIPAFRRAAISGARVELTNPDMTRFWLSADQAVELIMQSLASPHGGCILIPRLPAIKMRDVARACITMEGSKSEITEIGSRFGEKLHESLLAEHEGGHAQYIDGGHALQLWPLTAERRSGTAIPAYRSDKPDRWLTVEEIIGMIRQAPAE